MRAQDPYGFPGTGETMTQAGPLTPRFATGAGPQAVLPSAREWSLFDAAASRQIEQSALAACPPHALMAAAGLGVARLMLAVAPQARRVQVWAGPGNNGGDGLVAARHLHQAGLEVAVNLLGDVRNGPADAQHALAQARQAGVRILCGLERPWADDRPADALIDALLGLGSRRTPEGDIAAAVLRLQRPGVPVLAVDLPTGLCSDTGRLLGDTAVAATHTLSLLTLKPGLFTAMGRSFAGRVWFDSLAVDTGAVAASAHLSGPQTLCKLLPCRNPAQHKGSFGDVLVLGGAAGMGGAALLAASAALTAGAGRVYLARLDGDTAPSAARPELMPRSLDEALAPDFLARCTVVCGCGGGTAVQAVLPGVMANAARLVLDADALNALAADAGLRQAMAARSKAGAPTVLTPIRWKPPGCWASRPLRSRPSASTAPKSWRINTAPASCSRGRARSSPHPGEHRWSIPPATPGWAVPVPATCWRAGWAGCGRRRAANKASRPLPPASGCTVRLLSWQMPEPCACRCAPPTWSKRWRLRCLWATEPGQRLVRAFAGWAARPCLLAGEPRAATALARPALAARSRVCTAFNSSLGAPLAVDLDLLLRTTSASVSPSRTRRKSILRPSKSTRLTCTRTREPTA